MKRSKNSVIINLPYNFKSKQEAIVAKRKAFNMFNESYDSPPLFSKRSHDTNQSMAIKGPSLFYGQRKYSSTEKKKQSYLKPCMKLHNGSIEKMKMFLAQTQKQTEKIKNCLKSDKLPKYPSTDLKIKKKNMKFKKIRSFFKTEHNS